MNSDVAPPPVAEYDFHPKIPILLGRRQGNEEYEHQCDSRKAAGHVGASKYGRVLTRYPVVVKLENCVDGGRWGPPACVQSSAPSAPGLQGQRTTSQRSPCWRSANSPPCRTAVARRGRNWCARLETPGVPRLARWREE